MGFQFSPYIDLLNSIICAFCSYKLYRSYQRDRQKSPVLLFFSQGYLALIIAYIFFSLPRIIAPQESFYLGVGFVIAQAFLFFAVAFFAKVTTFFINTLVVQRVFWLVILISLVAIILSIYYFAYPQYDTATGITDWNINDIVGVASVVVIAGVLVPSMIIFFWQGRRTADKVVKIRSTLIAIGLLFLIITAYTYYNATTQIAVLTSDLFSLLSFLIIFFGIIYKRKEQQLNQRLLNNKV
ncbi:hypothetical protein KKF61_04625 [Patescibacteria group bacterium]|nr:hypothetical protein [Patescibacteria group bacterium]MBU0964559.1 hypothetical protein [Patescibacteria group bacterium]